LPKRLGKEVMIVTFHASKSLIRVVDELAKQLGYRNRSEFLREAVRYYVYKLMREFKEKELEMDTIVFKPHMIKPQKRDIMIIA